MNLCHVFVIIYMYIISYIFNYIILEYVSIYNYTSLITSLLIIISIDCYNILDEKDKLTIEYKNTNKLLELQLIENTKLQETIKAFKKNQR